jgi:hypothetical protein
MFQRIFGNGLVARQWYQELTLYSNVITFYGSYPGTFFTLGQAVLQMLGSIHHVEIQPADLEELGTRLLSTARPGCNECMQRTGHALDDHSTVHTQDTSFRKAYTLVTFPSRRRSAA